MNDTPDLSTFALTGLEPPAPRPRRPNPKGRFLKGPVPWWWLAKAAGLPGKALAVGVAVWLQSGLTKRNTVKLSLSGLADRLGVHRDAARRGLTALESAGLVTVERHAGRAPVVVLVRDPA